MTNVTKPRILLTEPLDAEHEARLEAGAIVMRPESLDELELRRAVADCDAMVARSGTKVGRTILEAGKRLRVIGAASVGLDHIDTAAAAELGIHVINTPLANADSVAEFTVALMLQLLRPIPVMSAAYARGEFEEVRKRPHGGELREMTIGIVGMGQVGSRVGRICAAGFGAQVVYHDVVDVGPFAFEARSVGIERIWGEADIVTLHVPLTDATRGMVNAETLGRMKKGAFLLNTCRGKVVETAALVDALRSGKLAGAALDVTDPEPLPVDHALRQCANCILTPHVAARTYGGLGRMYGVVDEVLAYLRLAAPPETTESRV